MWNLIKQTLAAIRDKNNAEVEHINITIKNQIEMQAMRRNAMAGFQDMVEHTMVHNSGGDDSKGH